MPALPPRDSRRRGRQLDALGTVVHLSQLLEDLVIASPQTSRQENVRHNMAEYKFMFGPRSCLIEPYARFGLGGERVPSIRRVQPPALIDDRRASLTVLARDTIRPGDYVVVTDEGARRLSQTGWPGSGAILGRALERIEAGHRGRVRDVS